MRTRTKLATITLPLLLLPFILFADQHQVLNSGTAQRAYEILRKAQAIYSYCEPCGDSAPEKIGVNETGFEGRGDSFSVKVNGREIDLAYVYVKNGERWENLALLLGLATTGVSRVLDGSKLPEDREAGKATRQSDVPYLTQIEKEVVDEYNLARTNPGAYAGFIAETRKYYRGRYLEMPGRVRLITREGVAAVDEALRFLEGAAAVGSLEPSKGMSRAAKDHVEDTGPRGSVGHGGGDGSNPSSRMNRYGSWRRTSGENIAYGHGVAREIVMQLIIDDGVAGRGHRKNIFNPAYRRIGVGFGPHRQYGHMCVQTLAGEYAEK
ncbi:MAG: CAP domain-containing protein [Spirochaetes bacterium]|nr:CAP domain-containing protein [Spirochaetota bacterium]